jgi:hypothetical protein
MKQFFGFIKSDWKFLVIIIFLAFAIGEMIQMNRKISYIWMNASLIQADINRIQSAANSIKKPTQKSLARKSRMLRGN